VPLLLSLACETTPPVESSSPKPEQELAITFGGFIKDGPENELLDGQCGENVTRDVLECDIHNGLMKWNITEITFQVMRRDDKDGERHYYRERISIAPLQTETVTIKLGMELPADTRLPLRNRPAQTARHWHWLIVGAKGQTTD
jgi:hypothetical protein